MDRHDNQYTDDQLIDVLKLLGIKLGRTPKMSDLESNHDWPSGSTYRHRFGSWNAALQKAGFKPNRKKEYTQKELIGLLRERGAELGRTPKGREMGPKFGYPSSATYQSAFGSWNCALAEADLPIIQKAKYPKEELVSYLLKVADDLGRSPTVGDMKGRHPGIGSYADTFGSWNRALTAAGLSLNEGFYGGKWRNWQAFCEKAAAAIYGKIIRQTGQSREEGKPDIFVESEMLYIDAMVSAYVSKHKRTQIRKYTKGGNRLEFWCLKPGTEISSSKVRYVYPQEIGQRLREKGRTDLAEMCNSFAAGHTRPDRNRYLYSDDELLDYLKRLAGQLGRTPTQRDMERKKGFPSAVTYIERFSSWNTALKLAQLQVNAVSWYTEDYLLGCLTKKARLLGRRPTIQDINQDPDLPSIGPFVHVFGSWKEALRKAQIENEYVTKYDNKQLISFIRKLTDELGHVPSSLEMNAAKGYPSASVFKRAFGTYNKAVRATGLKPSFRKSWSDEELKECLRLLASKLKNMLRQKDMNEESGLPGATTYCKRFGSWSKALRAAGLL